MTTYHPNGLTETEARPAGKGRTEQIRDRVQEQSDSLMQRGAEMREQASETARDATAQGARFVRENPGLALAGALGLGLIIGLSVRGRY
jgi:ElaB/YqjD/DUF883 family membrane-anchored ribosome-binding protein